MRGRVWLLVVSSMWTNASLFLSQILTPNLLLATFCCLSYCVCVFRHVCECKVSPSIFPHLCDHSSFHPSSFPSMFCFLPFSSTLISLWSLCSCFSSLSLPPSSQFVLARDCSKWCLGERCKHSESAPDLSTSQHQPTQPCPTVISLHQSHRSSPFSLPPSPFLCLFFHGGTSSGSECLNFIYQPHYGASKPSIDSKGTHLNF